MILFFVSKISKDGRNIIIRKSPGAGDFYAVLRDPWRKVRRVLIKQITATAIYS